MNTDQSSSHCPNCGSSIPEGVLHGLCPRCLMLGVAEPTQPSRPGLVLPTVNEIIAAFPEFEILEMIGHGGMGAVFKVRQRKLEREVALKVLPRALAAAPSFAQRFHREAKALAKLNHPNIVTVHDFGEHEGWYFLVMEFVDGINLRQAMRTNRFSPEQALTIVPKICDALNYAHGEGVLHRDIKPENILLDEKGRVKIADFGIAKLSGMNGPDTALTLSGAQLGTVAYMAPEQIESPATVDHRADIYSLGVVFYEMLTGELPIGRFPIPSEKSPVNVKVDDVVLRTLEKEREKRYQTAGEMKTGVETLVGHSAPLAPSPPTQPAPKAQQAKFLFGPWASLMWILVGVFALAVTMVSLRMVGPGDRAYPIEGIGVAMVGMLAGMILCGTFLGWKNVTRLRNTIQPRRGIIPASIAALLVPLGIVGLTVMASIRVEWLAWLDGIVLIAILLLWFYCWTNPQPRPWSAKAVVGFTILFIPLLLLAHGWQSFDSREETRWAQEMNMLQQQINSVQARVQAGVEPTSTLQDLTTQMSRLHMAGKSSFKITVTSSDRLQLAGAALFAILSSLLGFLACSEMRKEPGTQRGLGMAKISALFWPIAFLPVLVVLFA